MGSHLPRTPQPAITRLRARKWGSWSLRSDCLITYPVSRHPKHAERRSVPTRPGCPRRTRLSGAGARPRSPAATWRLAVGGRGLPAAGAQVFPARSLPGPPRKGAAKRHGAQGGGGLGPGHGTQPFGFGQTLPAAAASGLTDPVVPPAPGHPSPPLPSGVAPAPARRGAPRRGARWESAHGARRAGVLSGWEAGPSTPFRQERGASRAGRAAATAAAASPRPPVSLRGDRSERAEEEEEGQEGRGRRGEPRVCQGAC